MSLTPARARPPNRRVSLLAAEPENPFENKVISLGFAIVGDRQRRGGGYNDHGTGDRCQRRPNLPCLTVLQQTLIVNSTADSNAPGDFTLREAIYGKIMTVATVALGRSLTAVAQASQISGYGFLTGTASIEFSPVQRRHHHLALLKWLAERQVSIGLEAPTNLITGGNKQSGVFGVDYGCQSQDRRADGRHYYASQGGGIANGWRRCQRLPGSTISITSDGNGDGGGVDMRQFGTPTITDSTLANNLPGLAAALRAITTAWC